MSNLGNVKSLYKYHSDIEINLKQKLGKNGYMSVQLSKNGITKQYSVHRLVAAAFIPNPDNLRCVNHRNEIKTDNRVENLEWCSHTYNNNFGKRTDKVKNSFIKSGVSKPVVQLTKDGILVNEYPSISEAARFMHCYSSVIGNCVRGIKKTAFGFLWEYKNKVN